jgi:hypothetical protein
VLATVALVLGLLHVPGAVVESGAARVPLTVSSWCAGARCGAPIAASTRIVVVRRGDLVRCVFGFAPRRVTISVGGVPVAVSGSGRERDWRATRSGGIAVTASAPTVWVTYVGRLAVR